MENDYISFKKILISKFIKGEVKWEDLKIYKEYKN